MRCALTCDDAQTTERCALSYRASFSPGMKIIMTTTEGTPIIASQELLDAPTDDLHGPAVTVQRHEVLDWLGPVDLYADRAQRLEIADAILASGSDDEATWLAGRGTRPRPACRPATFALRYAVTVLSAMTHLPFWVGRLQSAREHLGQADRRMGRTDRTVRPARRTWNGRLCVRCGRSGSSCSSCWWSRWCCCNYCGCDHGAGDRRRRGASWPYR